MLMLILLHLLPGAIATGVYILAAPLAASLGYPTIAALYVPAIIAIIVLELGFLLYQGRKRSGQLTLQGVIEYREPVPVWQYIVLPLLILVWGILVTGIFGLVDNAILENLFRGLPDWYLLRDLPRTGAEYPRGVVLTLFGFALVLNGLAGPIVEELYFRGYLLPRLERLGRLAPLVNVALFSLYHFWTPWQFFSRVAFLLPLVYVVWWKRNIYLGMIAHCAANLLGTAVLFAQFLQ
jgi:membrane protease YdiL (CAAX protease family)